ncbi:MAG TPA: DUF420 domain-containing protein [Sphingobacteriaceae bacterium]|nr:DUF420 domain-containing protein [Sphingobacteriaceae bacterium]
MASRLPAVNAVLNGISAVLLTMGYVAIRRRQRQRHQNLMLAATIVSGLFLISYLIKTWLHGTTLYGGTGIMRVIYLLVLGTHLTLAMALVPLVPLTLWPTLGRRWDRHRRWARITLPIWLYVSVTGVAVYLLLRPYY